jgi:peptidoglycan-N-acetylglucosamine deacetylase
MSMFVKSLGVGLLFALPAAVMPAAAAPTRCPNDNAIGVARTVEIDTTGGPGFGFEHYKAHDFLQQKEVVLTFDDGPQKFATEGVLAALAEHCTKATFFTIGKMALGYPEIIREVAKAGHTIGTHTWSHQAVRKLKTIEEAKSEIERGISAVKRAVGGPIAPFFRFPTLVDSPETIAHLGTRNIAMFSTDVDSFDFKLQPPEQLVKGVMQKLEKSGKGILLMHDIHKNTAKALPLLLSELKAKGFKIVHIRAKAEVQTLAEYDAAIEKDAKGLPQAGAEKATSSIVKTVEGDVPASEAAQPPAAPKAVAVEPAAPAPAPTAAAEPAARAMEPTAAVQDTGSAAKTPPPATTSSITRDVEAESAEGAKPADSASDSKSMSMWAKQLWESWFAK